MERVGLMVDSLETESNTFINVITNYHIVQNSGGKNLWRISNFKVLTRKTLANAQYLHYWQEKNFSESEGKLVFVKSLIQFVFSNGLTHDR